MQNILFFGDSLTAGYGLKNTKIESLPALVQHKIDADKLPYHVINGGLSGDTSAGGLWKVFPRASLRGTKQKPPLNLPQRGRLQKKHFEALSFGEGGVRFLLRTSQ